MMTISEKLQIIKDNKDAIKQAILDKGGNVSGDFLTYVDAIKNISCNCDDNTSAQKKDVNFYDYDGTLLHSYSKDEFLSLSQLPELPTRDGLICQEWNYNISDAKTYVEEYGVLDIGATYITDDGKTRLYIRIAAAGRMDVPLYFSQTVSNGVTIDWGDGSATQTISGTGNVNTTHAYTNIGDYVITLDVTSGALGLGAVSSSYSVMGSTGNNGRVYCSMLRKVEIGSNVTSIGNQAFYYCYSLSSVAIPNSVTSIGGSAFYQCYSLASIVIPNSMTSIGGSVFRYCYSLDSIIIPNSVTSIGNQAFYYCYSLASIVIPNRVTSIGSGAFYQCYSLASIVIPNSMTSIGGSVFPSSYALASIVIPSSVKSIGTYAFSSCYGMAYYDFRSATEVPTLSNTNAFQSIPSDCKIIVPDSLYDSWKSATNWSTYATKIVKASAFNG